MRESRFLGGLLGKLGGSRDSVPPFGLQLPDGWVGAPPTQDGRAVLATHVLGQWPGLAETLRRPLEAESMPSRALYMAVDLQSDPAGSKPTLLSLSAYTALDLECEMRQLAATLLDKSGRSPATEFSELPAGTAGRLVGAPADAAREATARTSPERTLAIYRVHGGSVSYEAWFESESNDIDQYLPVFQGIMETFTPPPDLRASEPPRTLPHLARDLELLIPDEVLGRPICTWSVVPFHNSAGAPQLDAEVEIASALGLDADDVAYAATMRFDPDPPFLVSVVRFRGARETDLAALLGPDGPHGWALVGERTTAGRRLHLVSEAAMPGMAGGRTYMTFAGDTRWYVSCDIDEWIDEFVRKMPAPRHDVPS